MEPAVALVYVLFLHESNAEQTHTQSHTHAQVFKTVTQLILFISC